MDLVSRVKNILVDPKSNGASSSASRPTPPTLLKNYVAILAAIPAVCGFIGTSIIGVGPYRTAIVSGFVSAIVGYLLTLVGVFIVALVIDTLADSSAGGRISATP